MQAAKLLGTEPYVLDPNNMSIDDLLEAITKILINYDSVSKDIENRCAKLKKIAENGWSELKKQLEECIF